jgi:short-subunit dehydrogenase
MKRLAVITGASSGIGEAAARELASDHQVVLVARREELLAPLAETLGGSFVACDLRHEYSAEEVADHVRGLGIPLGLLVNNAGAGGRGAFAESGYEGVRRTMELNFDAQVRLTEALLPLLREAAPSAIVNVSSTAARVSRPGVAAYSASKAALSAWSDGLAVEEKPHGVHVGLVLPGFIETPGFPARELVAKRSTRWAVGRPEQAAEAIRDAGPGGRHERFVPRGYGVVAVLRTLAPGLVRLVLSRAGDRLATRTASDD